ncbi:MAG: cation diffusion facilitator family transporter [Candidatus Binatia bacterium]|nr:cation diffusion facilitator family transporter [Candidatus Binatia bacterium]
MSAGGGTKAIIAAFLANLGIAIAKVVGFVFTGSSSMLAESIHSFADTGNQGLLMLGHKLAQRDATPQHPFGYGRERYFWAFVVSLVLFALGSVFSVVEGIEKIRHPHPLEDLSWAIGILCGGILLEGWSFRTAVVEANHTRGRASWTDFIRRSRSPELPVVLLEDAGALIGLVIALAAVSLAAVTGNALYDGVGTLLIGLLLGVIAIVLAVEMRSLLIGEGARREDREKIVTTLSESPHVVQLIHMRTQHIGPEELLVGAKVEFKRGMSTTEIAHAIDALEVAIRSAVPIVGPMYIEPDLLRPTTTTAQPEARTDS